MNHECSCWSGKNPDVMSCRVLNDFKKISCQIVCLFVGAGETEDKASADQAAKVCSEATAAKRGGKYLHQTTSRKYAQH